MEIVGLDTGFFIKVFEGEEESVRIWNSVVEGELKAITSSLVLFELKRLFHRLGKIERWDEVREAILLNCEVVSVDVEVAQEGASVSHGTGLPAIDALIYVSVKPADRFYTADGSFEAVKKKKPKVVIFKA